MGLRAAGVGVALASLSACGLPPPAEGYTRATPTPHGVSRSTDTPFEQDRRDYWKDRGP
jgi:hypothetical protein